jgi:Zn-dependent protease with chaperone function
MSLILRVIENFVLFSTLFTLVAFVFAATLHGLNSSGFIHPQPATLARFYGRALIVPPIAAAWVVIASLLPEWVFSSAAFSARHGAPLHDLHLWSELTAKLEPAVAYVVLAFVPLAAAFSLFSSWRMQSRLQRLISRLELNAEQPPIEQIVIVRECASRYGLEVGLVTSSYPFSFVWGFRRDKLIVSTGLLTTLTEEQLRGVIEHEAAHHRRRDNLVKLVLSVSACSSLAFPLSRLILKWRALEVEILCDDVAVSSTSAPLEIAEALVKLRRQQPPTSAPAEAALMSGFVSNRSDHFERRVQRLIQHVDGAVAVSPEPNAVVRAAIFAILVAATLAVLTVFSPLAVHHAAESLIQLL